MNAQDVIESYVTEVALQLPRKQRNDVAFELRALLHEQLQDKAEASGREADAAMATEMVRGFGHPTEVAARYRPTLSVIDPVDGHAFVRASVIGLVVIWCLGLVSTLQSASGFGLDLLGALGQWWGGVVIPSLWWPGVLVVGFAATAWARRRWPLNSDRKPREWKPRAGDRIHGGRLALVMGIVGIVCGLYMLIDPRWLLDVFWGDRAAPAAYAAFTYTGTFLHRQAPWLLALIVLNIPLFIAVIMQGRWSSGLRRLADALALVTCAVLAWTVLDGPIFMAASSDKTTRFALVLIIVFTLLGIGLRRYRQVRPQPSSSARANLG